MADETMTKTTKEEVTREEYLQLEGLLVLAKRHSEALADIEIALAKLLGMKGEAGDYFGHVSDGIYNGYTAPDLLRRLGIDLPEAASR